MMGYLGCQHICSFCSHSISSSVPEALGPQQNKLQLAKAGKARSHSATAPCMYVSSVNVQLWWTITSNYQLLQAYACEHTTQQQDITQVARVSHFMKGVWTGMATRWASRLTSPDTYSSVVLYSFEGCAPLDPHSASYIVQATFTLPDFDCCCFSQQVHCCSLNARFGQQDAFD